MHRHFSWTMGLLVCWLLLCGCQSFTLRPQTVQEEKVSEIVLALSEKLNEDRWGANQQWQVENILRSPEILEQPRWEFREQNAEDLLAQLDSEQLLAKQQQVEEKQDSGSVENETPAEEETLQPLAHSDKSVEQQEETGLAPWSGFLPGQLSQSATTNEFRKLVATNGIVGWNAAILWGQREPHKAIEIAPLLEELATEPHYYQPETGKQVRSDNVIRGQNRDYVPKRPMKKSVKQVPAKSNTENSDTSSAKSPPKFSFTKPRNTLPEQKKVSDQMQAAAAEVLCQVLLAQNQEPLDALAPIGRMLEKTTLPDLVRIEYYLGIARYTPPVNIPRLNNALRETGTRTLKHSRIRKAAYDACILHAYWNQYLTREAVAGEAIKYNSALWPPAIHQAGQTREPAIQQSYCLWLAVAQPPDAVKQLVRFTHHKNGQTKTAAYLALGYLNSGEAVSLLERTAQSTSIIDRIGAIHGLGVYGPQSVVPYVNDDNVKVKIAVAEELVREPTQSAYLGLSRLMRDKNLQVSQTITANIEHWPDDLALPLLVTGMIESPLTSTRKDCLLEVQKRTGSDETVLVEANLEDRRLHVRNWARKQDIPLSRSLDSDFISHRKGNHGEVDLRRKEFSVLLEKLEANLQEPELIQEVLGQLMKLRQQELVILEQELVNFSHDVRLLVYREVMPVVHPAYRAKEQLTSPLVEERRRAARDLKNYADRVSLPEQVVQELKIIMISEQDHEVWRYVMQAMMQDGTTGNSEIARMAVRNTWGDIRLLGCQYFDRYPQPEHAEWLRPLLSDRETGVQLMAVQVIGKCRNPGLIRSAREDGQQQSGLEDLLKTTDVNLRFKVLVSMMRLGDWRATNELEQLGRHPEEKVREAVITALGESGHSRVSESLLRLGGWEQNRKIQALILQKIEQLAPLGTQLPTNFEILPYDRKLAAWKSIISSKTVLSATSVPDSQVK